MKNIFKIAGVTGFFLLSAHSIASDNKLQEEVEINPNQSLTKIEETKQIYVEEEFNDDRHKNTLKAQERKEASKLADKMWGLKDKKRKKDKE